MSHTRFPRVRRLRRGYHVRQVDAFLARVETSLRGATPPLAAAEIRRAGFELVHHGYDVPAVDRHLDELEEHVLSLQGASGGRRSRTGVGSDAEYLRDQLDRPYMRRFPRAGFLRRGYEVDDVDAFVDKVIVALNEVGELDVEDVRAATFHPKRGGYAEEAVDETLDRVVELLLVKRRASRSAAADQGLWDSWTRPVRLQEPSARPPDESGASRT